MRQADMAKGSKRKMDGKRFRMGVSFLLLPPKTRLLALSWKYDRTPPLQNARGNLAFSPFFCIAWLGFLIKERGHLPFRSVPRVVCLYIYCALAREPHRSRREKEAAFRSPLDSVVARLSGVARLCLRGSRGSCRARHVRHGSSLRVDGRSPGARRSLPASPRTPCG